METYFGGQNRSERDEQEGTSRKQEIQDDEFIF